HGVCPVHDRGLEARPAGRCVPTHPGKDRGVVRVVVELVGVTAATPGPGVLDGGVEGGPGEVESGPASFGIDDLALQPHQEAQALRVSLEASAVPGHLVQSSFPVVTEGWMSQVV